jgi:hypothetical protein
LSAAEDFFSVGAVLEFEVEDAPYPVVTFFVIKAHEEGVETCVSLGGAFRRCPAEHLIEGRHLGSVGGFGPWRRGRGLGVLRSHIKVTE